MHCATQLHFSSRLCASYVVLERLSICRLPSTSQFSSAVEPGSESPPAVCRCRVPYASPRHPPFVTLDRLPLSLKFMEDATRRMRHLTDDRIVRYPADVNFQKDERNSNRISRQLTIKTFACACRKNWVSVVDGNPGYGSLTLLPWSEEMRGPMTPPARSAFAHLRAHLI